MSAVADHHGSARADDLRLCRALGEAGVNPKTEALAAWLWHWRDWRTGSVRVSNATLADAVNTRVRYVQKCIGALIEAKIIEADERSGGRGRVNTYRFTEDVRSPVEEAAKSLPALTVPEPSRTEAVSRGDRVSTAYTLETPALEDTLSEPSTPKGCPGGTERVSSGGTRISSSQIDRSDDEEETAQPSSAALRTAPHDHDQGQGRGRLPEVKASPTAKKAAARIADDAEARWRTRKGQPDPGTVNRDTLAVAVQRLLEAGWKAAAVVEYGNQCGVPKTNANGLMHAHLAGGLKPGVQPPTPVERDRSGKVVLVIERCRSCRGVMAKEGTTPAGAFRIVCPAGHVDTVSKKDPKWAAWNAAPSLPKPRRVR